ncbi:hypothetical protein VTL71DRAFT_313 [Oculimacula yallundae]|uniref:Uncharacterized protein n=1 Tax=Oculimacula yallundae TaxID=86028 RepID=A0ABR4CZM9_9HELO
MAPQSGLKPGSRKSVKALVRSFGDAFAIDLTFDEKEEVEEQPRPTPVKRPHPLSQVHFPRQDSASPSRDSDTDGLWVVNHKEDDFEENLALPQYSADFPHLVSDIGFQAFVGDLERLNGGAVLPRGVVTWKWFKLLKRKWEEWVTQDGDGMVGREEKMNALREGESLASEEAYEEYRIKTNGIDGSREIENQMKVDDIERGRGMGRDGNTMRPRPRRSNVTEAERPDPKFLRELKAKIKKEKRASKKADRDAKKAEKRGGRGGRGGKMGDDLVMGNTQTLTKPMGVKKNIKKKRSKSDRYKEVMEDPIARRLRSATPAKSVEDENHESPPLEKYLVAGLDAEVDEEMGM